MQISGLCKSIKKLEEGAGNGLVRTSCPTPSLTKEVSKSPAVPGDRRV